MPKVQNIVYIFHPAIICPFPKFLGRLYLAINVVISWPLCLKSMTQKLVVQWHKNGELYQQGDGLMACRLPWESHNEVHA